MVKTLREAKAKLSELVRIASRGEEIWITVRGKVQARLVGPPKGQSRRQREAWIKELRELQQRYTTPKGRKADSQKLWDELRADRF